MKSKTHRALGAVAAWVVAATAVTVAASPASAEEVPCQYGRDDFVQIRLHDDWNLTATNYCYANAGTYETHWNNVIWLSWLHTGDNVVRVQDCDGTWYGWHDRKTDTDWNHGTEPRICHLEIA